MLSVIIDQYSGRSRPSDKRERGGHPDPEKRGGGGGGGGRPQKKFFFPPGGGRRPNKNFFQPFGTQFGLKTRGVRAGYVQFQKNNFTRSEISQKRIEARYKNVAETRKC